MNILSFLLIFHFFFQKEKPSEEIEFQTVFKNGENGYQCFRIPAIVKAPNGEILAFAEGRKQNCGDFGDVEIVLKKSNDNGKTWSNLEIVADYGQNQAGNPAPVFDLTDKKYPKGRLFLFYNTGTASENDVRKGKAIREIWYKTSTDFGKTWSEGVNITLQVSKPNHPLTNQKYEFKEDWRSYANTPGHAIQLKNGKYKGRIFVAANHSSGNPKADFKDYQSHAFYTDNHAKSFKLSENLSYLGSNEAIASEISNGNLLINCRNQSGDAKYRILAWSKNGGKSWSEEKVMKDIPDPVCQGSMIDFQKANGEKVLLFTNLNSQTKREKLTIRLSNDDGKTWSFGKEIYGGSAAYSDLMILENNQIGILFEKDNYSKIEFVKFDFEWILK